MTDPTLIISIDRTALALSPLLLSASYDGTVLGVSDYSEPAIRHRIRYAPDSDYMHGSQALAASLEHGLLQFDATANGATTEAAARSAMTELRVALNQWSYDVTVTINGVAETWTCNPGSVGQASRSFENLKSAHPVHPVSIPCYPVRS